MNETERMMKIEKRKYGNLIKSAQLDLDSAKSRKASKGTISHLEQRIKSLTRHLKKIESILSKETENTTTPSGKNGDKKTEVK